MLHPPKQHVVLKVLSENNDILFLKKGIACGYRTQ